MSITTFINFINNDWSLLLTKIWEQFYLVSIAILLALIIGLPLGIVTTKLVKIKSIILGFVSALWTIPSLALLALFIPILGIGIKPAIVVLSIYAILPILRNTVAGLENVSPANIEAARGLGFTKLQRLWIVELPLALPVIIAGIRTSVSICVGVATLASFVGAGGLGDFINQGLALNNSHLILLGAVPAAIMALLFDYLIAFVERKISTSRGNFLSVSGTKKWIYGIFLILLMIGSVLIIRSCATENKYSIRIASKNFTEQIILGELISQLIETKTKLHVVRMFNLGTTAICHAAILNNEIDIYPEYTGTAYLTVLKMHDYLTANQLYSIVQHEYQKQFNLIWLSPFGFNNTQALAVREEFAKRYQLKNISDLKSIEENIIIGAPAEFVQREDALIGLKRVYQLQFGQIRQMDPGLMYHAIATDEVNVINAFSTDGRIPAYHLILLIDDKHFYPAYYAAPIIRANVLKKYPEIAHVLQPLLGSINDDAMQQLNYQVDIEHQTPYMVAKTYLRSKHLN